MDEQTTTNPPTRLVSLSPGEWRVLGDLLQQGPSAASEIAARLNMKLSTVCPTLNRLRKKGLIGSQLQKKTSAASGWKSEVWETR